MGITVIQNFVVNLIRKNHQIVMTRNFDNALQNLIRVQSACWIVWIDNHNTACISSDF